ncbi:MAG: hypothetical protein WKF37_16370 [Bryobacteraceae bacterium]
MKSYWSAAILLAGLAGTLYGQNDSDSVRSCDTWSLKGTYLLSLSGTRPAPFVLPGLTGSPGTTEVVSGLFLQTFDGKGGFTQAAPVIVKGALSGLFPDQPGSGVYSVNANCTGSFTVNLPQLPAPLENRMIIVNGGKEFRAVVVSPQALMISVMGKRID